MSCAGTPVDWTPPSDLVCFCFGITRETVLAHIRRPGSSYENLIKETQIGTKCTACRMNLEILLGDRVNFEAGRVAAPSSTDRKCAPFCALPIRGFR
jgi:bacterioferritin-associated ferredoxin